MRDFDELYGELDERILLGFGGVSASTASPCAGTRTSSRVLYIDAGAQRDSFRIYGGVRFGGTLTLDDAWELGFDHVAHRRRRGQADASSR